MGGGVEGSLEQRVPPERESQLKPDVSFRRETSLYPRIPSGSFPWLALGLCFHLPVQ